MHLLVATCLNKILLAFIILTQLVSSIEWKYSALLDNNFLMLWTPGDNDVTFEVHVKTAGYIGFGFMRNSDHDSIDIVIGWIDNDGQAHLQDRHIKGANRVPQMDSSQDYHLQSGYENETHTVLRFNRRYNTCDNRDLEITNDTLQIIWQYHVDEPVSAASLLPMDGVVHGVQPLYLIQRNVYRRRNSEYNHEAEDPFHIWNIFNAQVNLPMDQNSFLQCRVFSLPKILQKHHVFRYEPIIEPGSKSYLYHMTLYECRGDEVMLKEVKKYNSMNCSSNDRLHIQCNTIAIIWSLGSEGFNYPSEVGYSLDPHIGPRFYMLETHFANPQLDSFDINNSGLRLFYTEKLRTHDAGVLRIGIDPNWRHIIPPGQLEVISQGHCIARCTEYAIPDDGVNIFAVIMHMHQLGKKMKVRQIRDGKEMPPIVADSSYDPNYQEYRKLQKLIKIFPGDHLISECTYSSQTRQTITLGGLTTKEETCLVTVLYYPKIDLSLCYSLPALSTILRSLGINKLDGPSPLKIISPTELKGMTLEEHLITYNWQKSFHNFTMAMRTGTFKSLCINTKGTILPETSIESYYPYIIQKHQDFETPCMCKSQHNKSLILLSKDAEIENVKNKSHSAEMRHSVRKKLLYDSNTSFLTSGSVNKNTWITMALLFLVRIIR
ncbi:PREDICTED: MOXD1 homolog 2 [Ceratosolen solmsi marchali]|uniref:MOXD1 homolog 2 n=1 Tax=Ceratosolen solmsi marchali TaxID=326594 RepID=A0AAJ6YCH9_9HYME|nr:PREDICTED: MOXD1 homolog 2 [Ceratosolen solmsi marchali]